MLETYSKAEVKTITEAINSFNPSIASIKKAHGETELKAVLIIILADTIKFFSVGKSMGEVQVVQTVDLILEEYYYFKIEDFKLCFRNAKAGKYGKLYDRLDGSIIFEWLGEYDFERLAEVERLRLLEHNEAKKEVLGSEWSDDAKENLKKILENLPKKEDKIKVENRNKNTDIVQDWMREFDKIHRGQDAGTGGLRFIDIEGIKMDINRFLLYKMDLHNK